MKFSEFLNESRKKENKIVFQETDGRTRFPNDTMTSLEKQINKSCRDLEQVWKNAVEVVNHSFNELDIPIPKANLVERWGQYKELISYAVKNLYDARGLNGGWTTSI